jgi:2-dehydro-3-deoxygluconokinase
MSQGKPCVVCFGEMLLRLSPPGHRTLAQTTSLDLHFGGAETNVAVSLAHLGTASAVATVLPDNALGRAARDALRLHGVDARHVRFAPGRMGLYFVEHGASVRASEVLYDRAYSAFAEDPFESADWGEVLKGADWLHISGVTPALGAKPAAAAERAASEARRLGVKIAFDGNYRAKLWSMWNGDAAAILRRLLALAELAFVDERDIALILGTTPEGGDLVLRRRNAARAAFEAFPRLMQIASTIRVETPGGDELAAVSFSRKSESSAPPIPLGVVVDRIGSGDAFAAGLLHAQLRGMPEAESLRFALAAAAYKHSIAGDFNPARETDIDSLVKDPGRHIRR